MSTVWREECGVEGGWSRSRVVRAAKLRVLGSRQAYLDYLGGAFSIDPPEGFVWLQLP